MRYRDTNKGADENIMFVYLTDGLHIRFTNNTIAIAEVVNKTVFTKTPTY